VGATYATAVLTAGTSTTYLTTTTAVSVARNIQTTGTGALSALVTISADMTVTSNVTCTLTFDAKNSGGTSVLAAGTFFMGVKSANSTNPIIATQVFPVTNLPVGPTTFQLQYKTSASSCTINKVTLVVEAP